MESYTIFKTPDASSIISNELRKNRDMRFFFCKKWLKYPNDIFDYQ
jgi:hypothetical protein